MAKKTWKTFFRFRGARAIASAARKGSSELSRDSRLGQRNEHALAVEIVNGCVDGVVECGDIGEGLMGEVMGLEVVPDHLDVVEFGRVFGQPFNREPVCASGEGGERNLADMDRSIVLDQHDRLGPPAGHRAVEMVELLEM